MTYEKWETERTHRVGLSVHEMQILLEALSEAYTCPYKLLPPAVQRLDRRLTVLRNKVMAAHNEEC